MDTSVYRTREGSEVIIFQRDVKGDRPVFGAYYDGVGGFIPCSWLATGMYRSDCYTSLDILGFVDWKDVA
jgi:hypothetical protein